MTEKSFMVQAPEQQGTNGIKLLQTYFTNICNKLERLSLASLSSKV